MKQPNYFRYFFKKFSFDIFRTRLGVVHMVLPMNRLSIYIAFERYYLYI